MHGATIRFIQVVCLGKAKLLYCYLISDNILREYGTVILKVAQIRLLTGHWATLSHVQNLGFTVLGPI